MSGARIAWTCTGRADAPVLVRHVIEENGVLYIQDGTNWFGAIDAEAAVADEIEEVEGAEPDDAVAEVETDASDDESFACVDGEMVEMPESVLAADAEAVCMSELARASEASAVIVEMKSPASDEVDAAALPEAESIATIDAGSAVESVARAETQAIPGEVEPEGDDEPSLPCATDRALDALSLFHGLGEDRWISTASRG